MSPSAFDDKVVIVTGSSNGIGRATARRFAELGAKVTITGRNDNSIKTTRELLLSVGTPADSICEVLGDLTEEAVAAKIVQATVDKFGRIDVLVNNAGGGKSDPATPNISMPIDAYDYTMNLNVRSIILLVQHAIPHLEKTQGAIVNVSSIAAFPFSSPVYTYYSMSKSAVDQLTVQLAGNLILKGIRVNSVRLESTKSIVSWLQQNRKVLKLGPGIIATNILQSGGLSDDQANAVYHTLGANRDLTPIGRAGTPDDIGKVIVFLADRSQSEFIVGQRIVADGGSVLRNNLFSASFEK